MVDQLDNIIQSVKANGEVKEVSLNLTFSYAPYATVSAVEQSVSNGVANVKAYLQENGLKDVKINTSYKVVVEKDGQSINNLDVNYKK